MMPICKYFVNSECTNPRCKFIHPVEYPVYIYTTPGIDIHPDELRWAVMCDQTMAQQADTVWLNNYKLFCSERVEKTVDILEYPDYFCMPFDPERVGSEIEKIRTDLASAPKQWSRDSSSFKRGDNNYSRSDSGYNRGDSNYSRGDSSSSFGNRDNSSSFNNNNFGGSRQQPRTSTVPFQGNRQSPWSQPSSYQKQPFTSDGYDNRQSSYPPRSNAFPSANRPLWKKEEKNEPSTFQNRNEPNSFQNRETSAFPNRNSQYSFPNRSSQNNPHGFDRAPGSIEQNLSEQESSQDYEQYHVPYNYK